VWGGPNSSRCRLSTSSSTLPGADRRHRHQTSRRLLPVSQNPPPRPYHHRRAADPNHLGAAGAHRCAPHLGVDTHPPSACPQQSSREGGVSPEWRALIACRLGFFLPVPGLSRLLPSPVPAAERRLPAGDCSSSRPGRPRPTVSFQTFLAALPQAPMPIRWGALPPHPSQTRTANFPHSGSPRENSSRGCVAWRIVTEAVDAVPGSLKRPIDHP